jgi:pimeloyl-ACP methyl ester carboxylesterase
MAPGRYEHRNIVGGIGHNLPQEAPDAFAKSIMDVASWGLASATTLIRTNTMNTLSRFKTCAVAAALLVASTVGAGSTRPSVVLVHGAFADGSSWAQVIPLLQAQGVKVIAIQNPLTSLEDDVVAAQRAIANQPGKVVLVGHSWGGTVITQAGADPKVAALVYVAAFAPDVGQSTTQLSKGYPSPEGSAFLSTDSAGFLALSEEGVRKHFAQDLPASRAATMAAAQGPIRGSAFDQAVTQAAWKTRPSWYVLTENDHMIPPAQQRDMAQRVGAKVIPLKTSHVPQEAQPHRVADVILDAVRSVTEP